MSKKTIMDLDGHPSIGRRLKLWVYSPVSDGFICNHTFDNVVLGEYEGKFLKAISWLNVGYFFLHAEDDPNQDPAVKPVLLPESWLNRNGATNHYIIKCFDDLKCGSMSSRDDSEGIRRSLNRATVATAATKAKPKPEDRLTPIIDQLTKDKIHQSKLNSILVTALRSKGYNVIKEGEYYKIQS